MRCDAMRCNVMAGGAATNHYFLPTDQPNLFYAATTCSPPSTFSGWWARFTSGVATGPSTQTRCTKPTQPNRDSPTKTPQPTNLRDDVYSFREFTQHTYKTQDNPPKPQPLTLAPCTSTSCGAGDAQMRPHRHLTPTPTRTPTPAPPRAPSDVRGGIFAHMYD